MRSKSLGSRRIWVAIVVALLALVSFAGSAAAAGPYTLPHFDSFSRSRSYGCSTFSTHYPNFVGTNADGVAFDCRPNYFHNGIDFVLTQDPVAATAAGIVVTEIHSKADYTGSGCSSASADPNYIVIDHQNGRYSIYLHLKQNSNLVHGGDQVSAGQKIATSGSSGYVCGAHLHYQLSNSATNWAPSRSYDPDGKWTISSTGRRPWLQDYTSQASGDSLPAGSWDVCYGEDTTYWVKFQNDGGRTWTTSQDLYGRGRVILYSTTSSGSVPAASLFDATDWESSSIVGGADAASVAPDGTATFTFRLHGGAAAGQTYTNYFNLDADSLYWFKYNTANQFKLSIYVVPHQACIP